MSGAAVGGTQRALGRPISVDFDLPGSAVMDKLQGDICQRVAKSILRVATRLLQTELTRK